MSKKVVITADSTCDLTPQMISELNVTITPLKILLGDEERIDAVNISPEDIYSFFEKTGKTPKTAAVTPAEYIDVFSKYADEGCAVVHIAFSSPLSSCYQNAVLAAAEFEDIYVIDSRLLCSAQALAVFKACELRDSGLSAAEIAKEVEAFCKKIKCSFIIPSLEFLSKGGRCSALTAFGANILGIKPKIEMIDGSLLVGKKYRGKTEAAYEKYMLDTIAENDIDTSCKVVFADSGISAETTANLMKLIKEKLPRADILKMRAGCTISSHCGPGTVALLFATK